VEDQFLAEFATDGGKPQLGKASLRRATSGGSTTFTSTEEPSSEDRRSEKSVAKESSKRLCAACASNSAAASSLPRVEAATRYDMSLPSVVTNTERSSTAVTSLKTFCSCCSAKRRAFALKRRAAVTEMLPSTTRASKFVVTVAPA